PPDRSGNLSARSPGGVAAPQGPQRQAAVPRRPPGARRLARGGGAAPESASQPPAARRVLDRDRGPYAPHRRGAGAYAGPVPRHRRRGLRRGDPGGGAPWARTAGLGAAETTAAPGAGTGARPGRRSAARVAEDALRGAWRRPEAGRKHGRPRDDRRR